MADDFNYWTSQNGYYPYAKTPNIDKLANMGVFFREAHCSSPVCNPSRNALWSGLRPSTTGIDANGDGFIREKAAFKDVVTMNQYFMQNGYWVYGAGKLYHPKMSPTTTECDPENWSYINSNNHGCQGGSLYKFCNSAKDNYCFSANPDPMTQSNCGDFNLAHNVKDVIEAYPASNHSDMPFFIACGVFRPHMPWNSPLDFWDIFNYDSLTKPPAYNPELDDPGNEVHQDFVNNGQWMRAIQAYLASCALADSNVGIMVEALLNSPYKNNTIICFMGDHGWNLGEKGRWGKFDRCDEANHTTLIIYDPSAEGNGQECIKPVSLQDLYPTLIELCGLPERKNVEGNSLRPLLDDPDNPDINAFALMMYGDKNYIKTDEWRFIDDGTSSLLHHNPTDPYQWNNLYGQPAYDAVVADLRHKIDSIIAIGTSIKNNYFEFMPPILPSDLEVKPVSSKALQITWKDNSNNEIGFKLYRRTDNQGDFNLFKEYPANTEIYIDDSVSSTNTYSYFIEVFNAVDTLATEPVTGIQPEDLPPDKPTDLAATPAGIERIELSWTDNAYNETGYVVFRKVDSGEEFESLVTLAINTTVYSDASVDSTNLYSYFVAAINEIGSANSDTVVNIKPREISYPGIAFNNSPWVMPGTSVEAWEYDKVGSGKDWNADSAVTIGLYNPSADGSGQDKRSYGPSCPYPAARWNGGGNTMRENGQWLRYTCTFSSGKYGLKIRGRNSSQQLGLTLRRIDDLTEVYKTTMNYPGDFINIGSGGDGSGVTYWFENKNSISIDAGTYIVELEVKEASAGGILGEFTFIEATISSAADYITVSEDKHPILINNFVIDHLIHLDLTDLNPAVWVKIFNLQGKLVQELIVGGEEIVSVELMPDLPSGFYILHIDDSDLQASEKFMLE